MRIIRVSAQSSDEGYDPTIQWGLQDLTHNPQPRTEVIMSSRKYPLAAILGVPVTHLGDRVSTSIELSR